MSDHLDAELDNWTHDPGCVSKHTGSAFEHAEYPECSYRKNGYDETLTGSDDTYGAKKELYNLDFTKSKHADRLPWLYQEYAYTDASQKSVYVMAPDPTENKKAWWIGEGENYKKGYLPIRHNYHHIMPWTSIDNSCDWTEARIIQESGYNLNAGLNVIILPCLDKYGYALMLPAHPGSHTQYNRDCKTIINDIKQKISGGKKGHRIKRDNVDQFKKRLEAWQKEEYGVLVEFGREEAKQNLPALLDKAPVS